jgi:transaldolase
MTMQSDRGGWDLFSTRVDDRTIMTDLLTDLSRRGLAIWLDDLDRGALADGTLARLVSERHVTGVTSNPTIFARSITGSSAYDGQLSDLRRRGACVDEARRALTTWDVRVACDVLRPVFEATGGEDGMVSIEVDPRFAYDPDATLADARGLWWQVDRPNLMVKIPATKEGLAAATACLAEGISVNVTLIFSATRYGEVFEAFVVGMAKAAQAGHDLRRIASVASLFVSRVDTAVDRLLRSTPRFEDLRGRAGLANARLAAEVFDQRINGDDWLVLEDAGARPQKLLWASTGVKDPSYDEARYVTGLALPGTINTMPAATLATVANRPALRALEAHPDPAEELRVVQDAGVDLDEVMDRLEHDGVTAFTDAWAALGRTIAQRLEA